MVSGFLVTESQFRPTVHAESRYGTRKGISRKGVLRLLMWSKIWAELTFLGQSFALLFFGS